MVRGTLNVNLGEKHCGREVGVIDRYSHESEKNYHNNCSIGGASFFL